MRYSQSEKMEIIRTVEESDLSVRRTLEELDVSRSTFYRWYHCYQDNGYDGLTNNSSSPKKFWNRIPDHIKEQVVDIALDETDKSPRELAWHITDTQGYYISESSVYRILKGYDLITSPAYIVLSASDKFKSPTKRIDELWQTDFTYFLITGWGWYYLSTVLDDYSRFILSWYLTKTMTANDVKITLDRAIEKTGVHQVTVKHKPRLLSDNGPSYLSKELKDYLENQQIKHTRGAPFHPMTQGKIERYHRSMKNVVKLQNYYFPGDLEEEISRFVEYYNYHRYHESLNNLTPADVYYGRSRDILTKRDMIKRKTMRLRKQQNLGVMA